MSDTKPPTTATVTEPSSHSETPLATAPDEPETWQVQRDYHKAQADNAFRCGGYQTAISEYTKAIEFDPELITLYSNRSAAYLKNSEISKALKDARKCVELDATFVKGHSRLAAALHALKRYEQALDAYQKVLELDEKPNPVAQKGVEGCRAALEKIRQYEQQQEEEKHKQEQEEQKQQEDDAKVSADDDDEDDLLNDFFADVEEVTQKKKEEAKEALQPKATNVIKHDKRVLGTAPSQMDRLLQDNHEWRNLNPFYVLQLPIEATEDDISRRYKALSLLLHPDKNGGTERAQQAFDEVKKAKTILNDENRAKHTRMLVEEGHKLALHKFKTQGKTNKKSLQELEETEVMRIFAQVEQKRREVEKREREWEQRERQQEDDVLEKERKERQFDKRWRKEDRVDKRVGNWRDFGSSKRRKK